MIKITIKNKEYEIPSKWKEVKKYKVFLALCRAMWRFETCQTKFEEFKMEIVAACIGVEIQAVPLTKELGLNFYTLSGLLDFPYRLEPNKDGSQTAFISISMGKNLLPTAGGVPGYKYETSGIGIIDTNMTAKQYTEALALINLQCSLVRACQFDAAAEVLKALSELLYPGNKCTEDEMLGIMYNARGIFEGIRQDESYDLIFRKPRNSGPSPVGSESGIFALTKQGFGDVEIVSRMGVHSFLSAMVQQTVDSIHTLLGSGMKPTEVADKLNLYTEQVLQFTTVQEGKI